MNESKYYHRYNERYQKVYGAGAKTYYAPIHNKELEDFVRFYNIPTNHNVLEFGCGEGRNAIFLAKMGFGVTAVDLSPLAIQTANELATESGVEIDFIVADVTDLDFIPDESFDVVVNNECLHMLTDQEDWKECLREMKRTVKSCGYIYYHNLGYLDYLPKIAKSDKFRDGRMREHNIRVDGEHKTVTIPCLPCRWVSKSELMKEFYHYNLLIDFVHYNRIKNRITLFGKKP